MGRTILAGVIVAFLQAASAPAETAGGSCEVVVTTAAFDPASHQLTYWEDGTTLLKIDGHEVSGSDGHVPARYLKSIELKVGSERFRLPVEATRDLFEPFHAAKNCTGGCVFRCDPDAPVLAVQGGDGAGAYLAVFAFSPKGRQVRRLLSEQPNPESASVTFFALAEEGSRP